MEKTSAYGKYMGHVEKTRAMKESLLQHDWTLSEKEKKLARHEYEKEFTNFERETLTWGKTGRLSLKARESIYRLYIQGVTVNEISQQFGILPARAKAIIWTRHYYHEEILPKIDRTT